MDREQWQVEMLERRRVVFEQLLWQVPSASFAGQAFLLTIVLRPDTAPVARLIAALFGLGAAAGVLVAYVKHRYTEEVYAEWINAAELRAERPRLVPGELLAEAYAQREEDAFSWTSHPLRPLVRVSAFQVWVVLLGLFLIGDVALTVMAIVEIAGGGTLLR